MAVRTDDITALLKQQILNYKPTPSQIDVGEVIEIGDGIALVSGLTNVMAGELVELNLAGGAYARMFHHGDYDRIHAAIDALYDWAIANDRDIAARPLFVHYCDDPEQTPVEALRAEIFLPLLEEKA